jgi:hypothetical protein
MRWCCRRIRRSWPVRVVNPYSLLVFLFPEVSHAGFHCLMFTFLYILHARVYTLEFVERKDSEGSILSHVPDRIVAPCSSYAELDESTHSADVWLSDYRLEYFCLGFLLPPPVSQWLLRFKWGFVGGLESSHELSNGRALFSSSRVAVRLRNRGEGSFSRHRIVFRCLEFNVSLYI